MLTNKEIIKLKRELDEKTNFIWLIGEIIKHSAKLQSESELSYLILDMLIGIFGLNGCSLRIKNETGSYTHYTISSKTENKFISKENHILETKFKSITSLEVFKQEKQSYIITTIKDFKNNNIMAYLSASHKQIEFFNEIKQDFFSTLTIQLSSVLINSQLYKKVTELSNKDILTNCFNRRYLDKIIQNNKEDSLTFILFDLDNFKLVNDTHGHNKGDQVLIEISKLATHFFEKYGAHVIRYGGDEFLILLKDSVFKALNLAKIFKNRLINLDILISFKFNVSASFGIANFPKHSNSLKTCLQKADIALYKAKHSGKDSIIIYKEKK